MNTIIKLDATDSTNNYLKKMLATQKVKDFTVVQAIDQYKGKGQMGNDWISEAGKNLTFSVLKRFKKLETEHLFGVSIAASLAVYKALKQHQVQRLSIKWPNDILSVDQKIAGILIENALVGNFIDEIVIGIGINVNQTEFPQLPKASSMKLLNGITYDLDELLHNVLDWLNQYLNELENNCFEKLYKTYQKLLFRKGKPSTFKLKNGTLLMGFIQGVSTTGKLQVLLADDILEEFDMKTLQLLY